MAGRVLLQGEEEEEVGEDTQQEGSQGTGEEHL